MSKYRKLIAAIIGVVAILLGPDVLGVTGSDSTIFGLTTETVTETIIGILLAAGVWAAPNTE